MPGALGLRHALHEAAVLHDHVMRRDLGARGAQPRQRALYIGHAGVVQQDHVRRAVLRPLAEIGGRDDVGDDRGVRSEWLHVRVALRKREWASTLLLGTNRRERTLRHRTTQTGQENGGNYLFGKLYP